MAGECCDERAFCAKLDREGFDGTVGGAAEVGEAGSSPRIPVGVGVRDPLGDAVGGGSDNDIRCRAELDGDGLMSLGSRATCRSCVI